MVPILHRDGSGFDLEVKVITPLALVIERYRSKTQLGYAKGRLPTRGGRGHLTAGLNITLVPLEGTRPHNGLERVAQRSRGQTYLK